MPVEWIPLAQLFVGSGILVMMLRIAVLVGKYTHRLESLEDSFKEWTNKVDGIASDVLDIKLEVRTLTALDPRSRPRRFTE